MKVFLDVKETANLVNISERSVREAVKRGDLKAVRVSHSVRVPITALAKWLSVNETELFDILAFKDGDWVNENRQGTYR